MLLLLLCLMAQNYVIYHTLFLNITMKHILNSTLTSLLLLHKPISHTTYKNTFQTSTHHTKNPTQLTYNHPHLLTKSLENLPIKNCNSYLDCSLDVSLSYHTLKNSTSLREFFICSNG